MNKSHIPIATPCGANWQEMTPESGARLCGACDKLVHDLSSMSEQRAKRLLASKENLCVRYLFDEHGNIWFAGDRPPLAARLLNRAKRGAAAAAILVAPFTLQACMGAAMADDVPDYESDAGAHVGANPRIGDDGGAIDNDAGVDAIDAGDASDDASDDGGDAGN